MHSSESGKPEGTMLRRVLSVLLLLAVVAGAEIFAQQCFDSVHMADYYNCDIRHLQETGAQVDMIIVGASQVYHACDVDLLSRELGIGEVIDASTASLTNDGGYYMLKDLLERFSPKVVLVNLTWDRFMTKVPAGEKRGRLLAMDRLPWAKKLQYAATCFPASELLNLSALYRFGGNVWGIRTLIKNYRDRKAIAAGDWPDESERDYVKNGFARYYEAAQRGNIQAEQNYYSDDLVSAHELTYIRKTKELCDSRGVQLIWVTMPTSLEELYSIENYQQSVDYARAFAEQTGCPWLNFSLLRGREDILPDTLYNDHLHLTAEGAEVFSPILADTLQRLARGEDVSGLFYDSFAQLQQEVHRIVACSAAAYADGEQVVVQAVSLQNPDVTPEYRLLARQEDGSWAEAVPWQESPALSADRAQLSGAPALRLEVRMKGAEEADAWQEIPMVS